MPTEVQLLGQPRVRLGEVWHPLPHDKRGALLLYLAHHTGGVSREQLASLFWPETTDAQARGNLRRLLSRVRELELSRDLEATPKRLHWPVESDVARLREALGRRDWAAVVGGYRGVLAANFVVAGAGGFESWLELERETLQSAYQEALLAHAPVLDRAGESAEAARLLRALLAQEELAEDVLQRYLTSAYLAGQREAALQTYARFAERLELELGLEPLPETTRLVATIRASKPLAVAVAPPPARATAPLSVLRPPTLVGRDALLRRARQAEARVLALAGEAGVGKTRLLAELAPEALWLRCREGLQTVPYHPVTTLLRSLLRSGRKTPPLDGYLEDLARLLPEVAPELTPSPSNPQTAKVRLLEALARCLEALAPPGAFQLVCDDAQWADEATLELLAFLTARGNLRLLLAYREHEVGPQLARLLGGLSANGELERLLVPRLDEAELRALLAQLMNAKEGPPLFSRWLHRQSGGNPMFALETLKALFESGDLHADEAGWHSNLDAVTEDYRELPAPRAVSEAVARRLAHLSEAGNRVLQVAAVMGGAYTPRALAKVAGLSEWGLIDALEEVTTRGLLHESGFSHDLVRQSIYQALPTPRRVLLHARVAKTLADALEPSQLAEHWLAAGEAENAVTAWLEAAESLYQRSLHHEALRLLERARPHAGPASAPRLDLMRAQLHKDLAQHQEAEALLAELLEGAPDEVRAAALDLHVGNLLQQGRLREAADAAEAGQALADALGDAELIRRLTVTRASVADRLGDSARALALLEPLIASARREAAPLVLANLLNSLAALYQNLGRPAEALPLQREALAIAKRLGARVIQVDVALNMLYDHAAMGCTEEALEVAEEALALGRYEGSDILRNNLAAALLDLERFEEAAAHWRQLTTESDDPSLLSIAWARLAELCPRLGRANEVPAALEASLAHAERTEIAIARARAALSALRLGTPSQRQRAHALLRALEPEELPDYLRAELESLQSA